MATQITLTLDINPEDVDEFENAQELEDCLRARMTALYPNSGAEVCCSVAEVLMSPSLVHYLESTSR